MTNPRHTPAALPLALLVSVALVAAGCAPAEGQASRHDSHAHDVALRAPLDLVVALPIEGPSAEGEGDVVAGEGEGEGEAEGEGEGEGEPPPPFAAHVVTYAPHADAVAVAGPWNGWSTEADLLEDLGDGRFAGDIAAAHDGDAYKLVIHRGAERLWRPDPRARAAESSVGNSVFFDDDAHPWSAADAAFSVPADRRMVIYELHIGSFTTSEGGTRVGTFDTAIDKLDWIAALGVTAVEVMPPFEFAGDYSWGYNPALPFAVERAYGGPAAMKRFVDAAHARGLAVLVDVVHNHWGPSDLPMWCFDGECLGTGNGGAYFYADWRRETGWGPRPDFGRAQVREFIVDNTRTLMASFHLDGMRWDSTVNIRQANGTDLPDGWSLLRAATDAAHQVRPGAVLVAEDFRDNEWVTKTTGAGGAGFDAQWDGGFFHPISHTLELGDDAARDLPTVIGALRPRFDHAFARVVYTESHDEVANGRMRLPAMIDRDHPDSLAAKKRSTLGAVLAMTAVGMPMMFMGQEMLEDGWFADTDPLDWQKAERFAGIAALYGDLIRLRTDVDGHTRGLTGAGFQLMHQNDARKVLGYLRKDQGGVDDEVYVLVNLANREFPIYDVGVPRAGAWRVRFNSDERRYDDAFGDKGPPAGSCLLATDDDYDNQTARLRLSLGTYSALILSFAGDGC